MDTVIDLQSLLIFLAGGATGAVIAGALTFIIMHRGRSADAGTLDYLQSDLARHREQLREQSGRNEQLNSENASLKATLDSERQRYQEQIQLLQQAREQLTREFENLANRIFEEKQANFSRQSKI